MTEQEHKNLDDAIRRQIEADRGGDPIAFFRGALLAIGAGVGLYLLLIWLFY